ncbi:deoxynucleoside kinase-like [Oppia nitens]|uniref:deoxynucleoside kinase-like n=1 Tax=Oppia nitens TaxID=1686743 RepID=UPI0023DADF18|nr:deoxynucleoside kinase-like [Oppia nitens]
MSQLITVDAATSSSSSASLTSSTKPLSAASATNNNSYITIAIEGNIGSGKTTFLQHIQQFNDRQTTVGHNNNNNVETFAEPIGQWRDIRGMNLFQLLHKDLNRWSFTFQSYVQLSMLAIHQTRPSRPEVTIKLMERSLYSARYCFVENLYRRQCMRREEYAINDKWFEYMVKNCERVGIDLIIYLRTDPEVAYERIRKRNRDEETGLTIDYLRDLHDLHEQWLLGCSHGVIGAGGDGGGQLFNDHISDKFAAPPLPAPVITIDANQQLDVMKNLYDIHSANIINGTVLR